MGIKGARFGFREKEDLPGIRRPHPNKKRADKAEKAIRTAYRNDERILTTEDITDILTDIRHLCDHRELDLYRALELSNEHYLAEIFGRDSR